MNSDFRLFPALDRVQRERFAEQWRTAESVFAEDPGATISQGDWLVQQVMEARGYPVGNFEERAAGLAVHHADVVQNYRTARQIAHRNRRGAASLDDLRMALVSYRVLFRDLLGADPLEPGDTSPK